MTDRAEQARQRAAATKRRRTRAAVIEAAEGLFGTRGWGATTMEAIAAEAGVGAATVYNHFPTKDALAAWALRAHVEHLLDPEAFADADPVVAVDEYVAELCTHGSRHRHMLASFLHAVTEAAAPTGGVFGEDDPRTIVPLVTVLGSIIARGQASGAFAADPPADDVALLLVQGSLLRVLTRYPEPAERSIELLRTWTHRLLAP